MLRQPRVWTTFIVAFVVIGFLSGVVAWAITTGHDAMAVINVALTAVTVVAAVIALRYADDPARVAERTVKPMQDMAAKLRTAASTLERMEMDLTSTAMTLDEVETSMSATANAMKVNLAQAERGHREEPLIHRLGQYERIVAALMSAALVPLPRDALPRCREASTATVNEGLPMTVCRNTLGVGSNGAPPASVGVTLWRLRRRESWG